MSKYTTELKYICERELGMNMSGQGLSDIFQIIASATPKIMPDYPIFDDSYRNVLNIKIITHYYFREIGFETVGMFKFALARKMREIMPYYNQLYKTELLKFNPLYTKQYSIDHKGNGTSQTVGNRDLSQSGTEKGKADSTFSEDGTLSGTTSESGKSDRNTNNTTNNTVTDKDDSSYNKSGTNGETKDITGSGTSETHGTDSKDITTSAESETTTSESKETTNSTTEEGENNTKNKGKTTTENNESGSDSGTKTTSNNSTDLYSDTPQGALNGVNNSSYLTNARKISGTGSETIENSYSKKGGGTVSNDDSSDVTSSKTTDITINESGEGSSKTTESGENHESGKNDVTGSTSNMGKEIVSANFSENGSATDNKITTTIGSDIGTDSTTFKNDETQAQTTNKSGERNDTNSRETTSDSYENSKTNVDTTDAYVDMISGYDGISPSNLIIDFRKTLLNIDMMIIRELEDLFMGVW